jgi:hypothetical protein
MERELVALLGAGLTAVASGFGTTVPVGAIDRGYLLVDILSRESGPRISAHLNTMVQNLWLAWQQTGISRDDIARHAGALPAIIELCRPEPATFAAARQQLDGGHRLAGEVIGRARQSAVLGQAGLDERVAFALLDSTFQVILADATTLPELMVAVDICVRAGFWKTDQGAAAVAVNAVPAASAATLAALARRGRPPEVSQSSPQAVPAVAPYDGPHGAPLGSGQGGLTANVPDVPTQLTPAAIAMIGKLVEAQGPLLADPDKGAADAKTAFLVLMQRLGAMAKQMPDVAGSLVIAAVRISEGDLPGADRALIASQEFLVHRATSNLAIARHMMQCAADVLAARAELEAARFDLRKAGRFYRAALRCFAPTDLAPQLHFLNLHAQTLFQLDKIQRDDVAYAEGLKSLAEACALPPSRVDPVAWAHANLQLGGLYIDLGERSENVQDYLTAAQHAGKAITIFQQSNDAKALLDAHLMQAKGNCQAGDRSGDVRSMDLAARSYQTALTMLSREQDPARWVETSASLGKALLRLATVLAKPQLLPAAIENLRAASQYAGTYRVQFAAMATETDLGRALLAQFANGGQPLLLDLAATAFRRAIKFAHAEKAMAQKGALQHELGMTLWAISDLAGDANGLIATREMLEAAVETLKGVADAPAAATEVAKADLLRLRELQAGGAAPRNPAAALQYL